MIGLRTDSALLPARVPTGRIARQMVSEVGFVDGRDKAEQSGQMTGQQAATSAATGEQSQQLAMASNISEFMAKQVEQDAQLRVERAE